MNRFGMLLVVALLGGCGHPSLLRDATTAYEYGHYDETVRLLEPHVENPAALTFNSNAEDSSRMDRVQTKLHVYLGLAHYRLGHREQALPLLMRGDELYRAGPYDVLPPPVVKELEAALADLRKK